MTTSPSNSLSFDAALASRPLPAGPATMPAGQSAFDSVLSNQLATPADAHSPEAIRKVAGDLVSQALILPILKQIRRGTFGKNTPFSPGTGEKTFGPEFDIQIADRIAHSARMAPTDAIAARLMQRYPQQQPPAATQNAGVNVHG